MHCVLSHSSTHRSLNGQDRTRIFIQINIWMAILLEHVRQLPQGCWTSDNVAMGMSAGTGTAHVALRAEVLPAVWDICIVCACSPWKHTHTWTHMNTHRKQWHNVHLNDSQDWEGHIVHHSCDVICNLTQSPMWSDYSQPSFECIC